MSDSFYESEKNKKISNHRAYIGGAWESIGACQFNFMTLKGLRPQHTLIDVGCGSLRGGVHFISYLDSNCYYGTDVNKSLIESGFEKELNEKNKSKVSLENNFIVSDDFNFNFNMEYFDYGIALSLFTHLSENRIVECLNKLRKKFTDGGKFYASFFLPASSFSIPTYSNRDPFHYNIEQMRNMAEKTNWNMKYIGDFKHPRGQRMLEFTV